MSVQAISWAFAQEDLQTGPKFVLVALANYADADGQSWPSHERIAELCGMSRRSVRYHISVLIDRNLVIVTRRYSADTGYQLSSMYALQMGLSANTALSESTGLSAENVGPKCRKCRAKVQNLPTSGHERDTKEDTKEETRARAHAPAPDGAVFSDSVNETSKPKKKAGRSKQDDHQVPAPDWLDKGAWQEMIKHRKEMKAPMTERAQALMIKKLGALRAEGRDPVELIETAIMNGWKSVYAPKEENGNVTRKDNGKLSAAEETRLACEQWEREQNAAIERARNEFAGIDVSGQRIQ